MRGKFYGLKILIMKENKSTFYIYYFSHQLQLTLVKVVSNHSALSEFFQSFSILSNVVRTSCKHRDLSREKQHEYMIYLISNANIQIG